VVSRGGGGRGGRGGKGGGVIVVGGGGEAGGGGSLWGGVGEVLHGGVDLLRREIQGSVVHVGYLKKKKVA